MSYTKSYTMSYTNALPPFSFRQVWDAEVTKLSGHRGAVRALTVWEMLPGQHHLCTASDDKVGGKLEDRLNVVCVCVCVRVCVCVCVVWTF